jgi:hypothetical protein
MKVQSRLSCFRPFLVLACLCAATLSSSNGENSPEDPFSDSRSSGQPFYAEMRTVRGNFGGNSLRINVYQIYHPRSLTAANAILLDNNALVFTVEPAAKHAIIKSLNDFSRGSEDKRQDDMTVWIQGQRDLLADILHGPDFLILNDVKDLESSLQKFKPLMLRNEHSKFDWSRVEIAHARATLQQALDPLKAKCILLTNSGYLVEYHLFYDEKSLALKDYQRVDLGDRIHLPPE